jgi:hypothetical protein
MESRCADDTINIIVLALGASDLAFALCGLMRLRRRPDASKGRGFLALLVLTIGALWTGFTAVCAVASQMALQNQ